MGCWIGTVWIDMNWYLNWYELIWIDMNCASSTWIPPTFCLKSSLWVWCMGNGEIDGQSRYGRACPLWLLTRLQMLRCRSCQVGLRNAQQAAVFLESETSSEFPSLPGFGRLGVPKISFWYFHHHFAASLQVAATWQGICQSLQQHGV